MNASNKTERSPTLGEHFKRALREAHHRRPVSFYLLFSVPLVLILCAGLLDKRDNLVLFTTAVALLFVYFGVILHRALRDVFEISRRQLGEHREMFKQTLGQREFVEELDQHLAKARSEEIL